MQKTMKTGFVVLLMLGFAGHLPAQPTEPSYVYIPDTISEEAQAVLRVLPDPSLQPELPAPGDIKAWRAAQQEREAFSLKRQKPVVDSLQPAVTEMELGGVPVLEIKPRNWKNNGKVLVYTHGGAYTMFSAKSTLGSSALTADATGLRVISVDYTLAPHAKWQQVTDQVISVFEALRKQGYAMQDIAIYGDSAGGS